MPAVRFGTSTVPSRQIRRRRPALTGRLTGTWPSRRAMSPLAAVGACIALLLSLFVTGPIALGAAGASATSAPGVGAHYVALGGSPGMPELDAGNDTIYVPLQCTQSYCQDNAPGTAVDVVNAATCNSTNGSGCRVVATAPADNPIGAAVDPVTGTVYVMNSPQPGNDTISLFDGRTCNGTVTSGCRHVLATIPIGPSAFIVAGAVDIATRTLYVASPTHGVYVVDIAACNDEVTSGCGQHPALVMDDRGPGQLDIDTATNTIYVADQGNPNLETSNASTVTVINGNTCNGSHQSGCATNPSVVTVGIGVSAVAVDRANNTVYVAKSDGVSLINSARCSSLSVSGCHDATHFVATGAGADAVVFDPLDHTVFALNGGDDTISSINAATCDGATPGACPALAPSQREAPEVGPGATPTDLIVTPGDQSAYAVNEGGANVLTVTSVGGCTALDHSGCRVLAPSVPEAGVIATLDPATGTLYVTNGNLPQVDVIDAARCNPARLSGCVPVGKIPTGGPSQIGPVDDATHTLFVAEATSSSVAVINTSSCNAADVSGCGAHHARIRFGGQAPYAPLLDEDTGALYVPYDAVADKIAVIGAQTCNAEVSSGCEAPRGTIGVPEGTYSLALDPATDTVYGAVSGNPFASGNAVVVINGADCVGDMARCGKVAATISLGAAPPVVGGPAGPDGLAVDVADHTLYVVDNHDGNLPGALAVVNTTTCNGFVTTGCADTFPTTFVGRAPRLADLDARTGLLYVTNDGSSDVSVLDTARCNAQSPAECTAPVPEVNVGSQPNGLAVDALTGTVYVLSQGSGTMSLLRP